MRNRWAELRLRVSRVEAAGHTTLHDTASAEERAELLVEAQTVVHSTDRQAEEVRLELALLADQRKELEAQEAALRCMEGAWTCVVQQNFVDWDAEDLLQILRNTVSERVVGELLNSDPRLNRHRDVVMALTRATLGSVSTVVGTSRPSRGEDLGLASGEMLATLDSDSSQGVRFSPSQPGS